MAVFLTLMLMGLGMFLILLILLQKGRGGGLAGAFGGMGGQSALGTKAGDVFTRVTIGVAVVWVVLAGVTGLVLEDRTRRFPNEAGAAEETEIGSAQEGEEPPIRPPQEDGAAAETEGGIGSAAEGEAARVGGDLPAGDSPEKPPAEQQPAEEPAADGAAETAAQPAEEPAAPAEQPEATDVPTGETTQP